MRSPTNELMANVLFALASSLAWSYAFDLGVFWAVASAALSSALVVGRMADDPRRVVRAVKILLAGLLLNCVPMLVAYNDGALYGFWVNGPGAAISFALSCLLPIGLIVADIRCAMERCSGRHQPDDIDRADHEVGKTFHA